MSLSRKADDITPSFLTSFSRFLLLIGKHKSLNNSFGFLYVLLLNSMTGTAELRRLQYGEEDNISMSSIATSNGKVIPYTEAKTILSLHLSSKSDPRNKGESGFANRAD